MKRKIKKKAREFFLNTRNREVSKEIIIPDLNVLDEEVKESDISKYLEYYFYTSEIHIKIRIKIILAKHFCLGTSYRDVSDTKILELAREYKV